MKRRKRDIFTHETVLLHESVEGLNIKENGVYVDCTFGRGGHAAAILDELDHQSRLFAFDADADAIAWGQERFKEHQNKLTLLHANFRDAVRILRELGVNKLDGVLFDLGVSSPQLDDKSRGFSYRGEEPLDMRMDQRQSLTADEVVNTWPFEKLVRTIFKYGEEKFAKQIARAIEQSREKNKIVTTGELADIVKQAIPAAARRSGGHPAKRTFQAIRIAVNEELQAFEEALRAFIPLLTPGGSRVCVITFHSLEDRLAKRILDEFCKPPALPPGLPVVPSELEPPMRWVHKKPITPNKEEIEKNRRARSARLRIAETKNGREGAYE